MLPLITVTLTSVGAEVSIDRAEDRTKRSGRAFVLIVIESETVEKPVLLITAVTKAEVAALLRNSAVAVPDSSVNSSALIIVPFVVLHKIVASETGTPELLTESVRGAVLVALIVTALVEKSAVSGYWIVESFAEEPTKPEERALIVLIPGRLEVMKEARTKVSPARSVTRRSATPIAGLDEDIEIGISFLA